ncbi:MAG TPA: hypothetical protein VJP02_27390 [Candidatus Sulfotelmatobacter sp.]|nr:hypothetical protein [Candidatus Sulfotelmatobacter sp.]
MLRNQTGRFATQVFAAQTKALLIAAILYFGSGCSSSTKSVDAKEQSAASGRDSGQKVDISCLGSHLENPSEPYHYSFKSSDGQNAVDKEADITPQTMDITIQDNSGSHKFHGDRSKEGSWDNAMLELTGSGLTVMTARVAFIENTSASRRIGDEPMNGYSTTQYSIDTTNGNASDAQTFRTMFGAASYDKGTMWVGAGGCPVKLILDEGTQQNNGNVDKHHFEIAASKK